MELKKLYEAAQYGNVEVLREALATKKPEFFLPSSVSPTPSGDIKNSNFIQVAVMNAQEEFLQVALNPKGLPLEVRKALLTHTSMSSCYNAYHIAAARGSPTTMRLLLDYGYAIWRELSASSSSSSDSEKPWLARNSSGGTPLHVALFLGNEQCALQLLEGEDSELLYNVDDDYGSGPLAVALKSGCQQVALKILQSNSYSTNAERGVTPLDVAPTCTDEEICRILLQKHPEMITKKDEDEVTLLNKWVTFGKLWPIELLVNREDSSSWRRTFMDLMCSTDKLHGYNPLHVACYNRTDESVEIAQLLLQTYMSFYEKEREADPGMIQLSPLKKECKEGATPLILALLTRNEKLAMYYLSIDLEYAVIYGTTSALFYAVYMGCDQVVEMILTTMDKSRFQFMKHTSEAGNHVLHMAAKCKEETAELLVKSFPSLVNTPDRDGKMPLDVAAEEGSAWLIKLLLTKEPSSITKAPNAWITACEKGRVSAVEAFMNYCKDFRKLCLERRDTPLHHIQLQSYQEYQDFIAIPLINEMKNSPDYENSTPLHRAIERKDIVLAEVLLTEGVDRTTIKNKNGKTATDLLLEMYNQDSDWEEMCKRIRVNPRLKTIYITGGGGGGRGAQGNSSSLSVGEMRATLSVVAALLATLTFAAGFTLPGGLNQDTGEALMPAKAAFLVFILADTYAMCCSMLVLFCLIWSMVCDHDKSLVLIDRSVLILMQSLYGTLLAFMTGIYAVISRKSLWAAIIIFVMCSLVGISANRSILYRVIDKLIPSTNNGKNNQDQAQLLGQQGNATAASTSNSQNTVASVSNV